MPLDVNKIRQKFPALQVRDKKQRRIYFDNPGGTQVPEHVIHRMRDYLISCNANHGGYFITSEESDRILRKAHLAMSAFLNAESPQEIIFGPNMTTLTFAIARSIGHLLQKGDEIIVTRMDHDGNVAPWVLLADDLGLTVKWLDFNTTTYRYDLNQLEDLMNPRVRLLAVNYASNALGTINDVKKMTEISHRYDAMVYVDAVQYVPHAPVDVRDLDCDFLACSAYKFFGPHQGILYGKKYLLEKLKAYKVRPADDHPPGKFETGTQSHEGQAGTLGALEYLYWIGETMSREYHSRYEHLDDQGKYLHAAMTTIKEYEQLLSRRLIENLQKIPGLKIHGITGEDEVQHRVPTVSFTVENLQPARIAKILGSENIFVWDGDFYALEVIKHLKLDQNGGLLRVGAVHYNTADEIDALSGLLEEICSGG